MFWIATAFLAAGLFLAPAIGGHEPRFQRLGVNVLFGALLVVVAGSLAGEYLAIHQKLALEWSFWFGHQGYEYVDLGRVWQIALFAGLAIWLTLMLRALWPALVAEDRDAIARLDVHVRERRRRADVRRGLLHHGAKTHLTVMEYWRWWVVHLWVEGFFEVFATAALSLIFARHGARQGLARRRARSSARARCSSSPAFPGTFHHLYFSGTPTSIMAVGASFSALEVIPLVLIGLEACQTLPAAARGAVDARGTAGR